MGVQRLENVEETLDVLCRSLVNDVDIKGGNGRALNHGSEAANQDISHVSARQRLKQRLGIELSFVGHGAA